MITNSLKSKTNIYKISLTAYRAVKLLELLIEKPCSGDDIIEYFKQDNITENCANKDTLRITLNSLKAVGCQIKRPSVKTNYCYVLENYPFKICLSKENLTILDKIRNNILNMRDMLTCSFSI